MLYTDLKHRSTNSDQLVNSVTSSKRELELVSFEGLRTQGQDNLDKNLIVHAPRNPCKD